MRGFYIVLGVAAVVSSSAIWAQEAKPNQALQAFRAMIAAEEQYEVMGVARETIVFPPRHPALQPSSSLTYPRFIEPELVERNFLMNLTEGEPVAGRGSWRLDLVPRDGISPQWSFWLDREHNVRLGYEQRDARHQLLAEGRYDRIERFDNYRGALGLRFPEERLERLRRTLSRFPDRIRWPEGYVPVQLERTRIAGHFALSVTAWDGLNSLVFIVYPNRAPTPPQSEYLSSRTAGRVTFSVLGPLAPEYLEEILEQAAQGPLRHLEEDEIRRWSFQP